MAAKYCEYHPDCTQIVYDEGETKCRACRHYDSIEFDPTPRVGPSGGEEG